MKKFKKSIFFSLIFSLLSAFVLAGTPSFGSVYASIDDLGKTSKYLTKQSATITDIKAKGSHLLYNSNTSTTESYYSIRFIQMSTNNFDAGSCGRHLNESYRIIRFSSTSITVI